MHLHPDHTPTTLLRDPFETRFRGRNYLELVKGDFLGLKAKKKRRKKQQQKKGRLHRVPFETTRAARPMGVL